MHTLRRVVALGGIMVLSLTLFTACAEEETGPTIHPLPEGITYNVTDNNTRDLSYTGCDRIQVDVYNVQGDETYDRGPRYELPRQDLVDTAKHIHEELAQEHDKVSVNIYPSSGSDGTGNWYVRTDMDFNCDNDSNDYEVIVNEAHYPRLSQ